MLIVMLNTNIATRERILIDRIKENSIKKNIFFVFVFDRVRTCNLMIFY